MKTFNAYDFFIEQRNIKDKNFKVGDITVDNYNQKLLELKKLTRLFELYEDMTDLKDSIRLKSKWVVAGFSALAFGTSALSLLVPLVDTSASNALISKNGYFATIALFKAL